jgi:hypothetical protein
VYLERALEHNNALEFLDINEDYWSLDLVLATSRRLLVQRKNANTRALDMLYLPSHEQREI